jgi:polar amino acid transport system permease protein
LTDSNQSQDDIVAVPLKHPWRWVSALIVGLVLVWIIYSLVTAPTIRHDVISKYLFDGQILEGAWLTVVLTFLSMFIATVLAVLLAIMRISENIVLRASASLFVNFFRGTPLLLQIVFWGYLGIIWPNISLGVPFTNIVFFSAPTNDVISAFTAGVIALSLNEAAYASEIVRAGITSVDAGQSEAAKSLGMTTGRMYRRIVLPQAMRVIIPPMGNETISMLKSTSLLAVVAVMELYTRASQISSQNLAQIELLVVAGFWYLVLNAILSVPQSYLEKKYGRGFSTASSAKRWFSGVPKAAS